MAAGDITPTSPRTDTGLVLREMLVSADGFVALRFADGLGNSREAVIKNGESIGFDYSTGNVLRVSTPTGFTDALTAMGLSAARRTGLVTAARNAGVITVTGTVG